MGFFLDRVSQTICPGLTSEHILLIAASWVAGITGVSHQCLAEYFLLEKNYLSSMQHTELLKMEILFGVLTFSIFKISIGLFHV
jgi:hypothetical protein